MVNLTAGQTYSAKAHVVNTSTQSGQPVAAQLTVFLSPAVGSWNPLATHQSYQFGPGETHDFSFPLAIPSDVSGSGIIIGFLSDPGGKALGQASLDVNIAAAIPPPAPYKVGDYVKDPTYGVTWLITALDYPADYPVGVYTMISSYGTTRAPYAFVNSSYLPSSAAYYVPPSAPPPPPPPQPYKVGDYVKDPTYGATWLITALDYPVDYPVGIYTMISHYGTTRSGYEWVNSSWLPSSAAYYS